MEPSAVTEDTVTATETEEDTQSRPKVPDSVTLSSPSVLHEPHPRSKQQKPDEDARKLKNLPYLKTNLSYIQWQSSKPTEKPAESSMKEMVVDVRTTTTVTVNHRKIFLNRPHPPFIRSLIRTQQKPVLQNQSLQKLKNKVSLNLHRQLRIHQAYRS